MRRGILFLIILAALVVFAWQVVLKPKPASRQKGAKKTKADTSAVVRSTTKKGRKVGKLKRQTKEERKAEKERIRAERKRLRQELRRRRREERLAKRGIKRKRSGRTARKGTGAYVLQAIIWFETGPSYAMIDGRRYEVGDIISGRRVVAIKQDQIIVEYQGTQTVVRMGDSVLPRSFFETGRRRR